ncbi:MAG TPA: tail fiber protein [Chthoniobacterales bacterium]|nr:tail fiber protein [Chthoniobacterales bacterium]
MSQPFIGEIRMFAGNFAPAGWMFCDGQLLPISENDALFTLIGTTYGGDGQETFALPNLQSRVPIHAGTGPGGTTYQLAEMAGTEQETLTVQQIPIHNHALLASTAIGTANTPSGNVTSQSVSVKMYLADQPTGALNNNSVTPVGGSQPHENCQPFLCINYIISLFGIFPRQS